MGRRQPPPPPPLPVARLLQPLPPVPPPPPPPLLLLVLLAAQNASVVVAADAAASTATHGQDITVEVERLVRRWAPLVWLAPGERFFPSAVPDFLRHVTPRPRPGAAADPAWFLVTNDSLDKLVEDESSFLFGRDPSAVPVPVYALVRACGGGGGGGGGGGSGGGGRKSRDAATSPTAVPGAATPRFHVTYWMFYPFSQGKAVCSVDLGPLGVWPLPLLAGVCLGSYRDFGSHVGDWEHVSLLFQANATSPDALYLSAHDAGAFYRPSGDGRRFVFERQEVRRGLLQRPTFPSAVRLAPAAPAARGPRSAAATAAGRLELFAARGSHGLWAAPGTHRYVRLPRLYDHSGYGTPWATWRALRVVDAAARRAPGWLAFRGRWGNPRSKCHPLARLGLALCQFTDGPTGIPLKEPHFRCDA